MPFDFPLTTAAIVVIGVVLFVAGLVARRNDRAYGTVLTIVGGVLFVVPVVAVALFSFVLPTFATN